MTDTAIPPTVSAPPGTRLTTVDGRPLDAALRDAQSRLKWRAFLLVLPLLAFIVVTFIIPIGQMLYRSVHNEGLSRNVPHLSEWFDANPAGTAPDEAAYEALVLDLRQMAEDKTQGEAGQRMNYDLPGTRSLFTKSARRAEDLEPPYKAALLDIDADWGDQLVWSTMRSAARPYTIGFYLAALDMTRNADNDLVPVPDYMQVYRKLFLRTFVLSAVITALTLLLGFPIAHLLATLPLRHSNLLMIFVLLPFWTSLLVRTTSWIVLLQGEGVVNDLLVSLGIISDDGRIAMMYNQTGAIIAMTHILLPFMVLPLYSVMRTINPSYVRAARSLGATSWTAFRRIYLPLTIPGMAAGALLVFILAVGYYITPALVGGASGQLISNLIAERMSESNWSLAAALATLLLAAVLLLYWLYDRLVGIDNLKLG